MSHNSNTKEVESEVSNKSDESVTSLEKPSQEQSSTTETNKNEVKSTESNENKVDLEESSPQIVGSTEPTQQKVGSAESSQQEVDSTESRQEEAGPTESSQQEVDSTESRQEEAGPTESKQQEVDSTESSQKRVSFSVSSQTEVGSQAQFQTAQQVTVSESVRQIVIWTMTGFFDFNPKYFTQMRGLINIVHISLSLTILILLSLTCQLRPYPNSPSEGFYCKPPETFLFVVSCCSFFTAVLYLFCCVLSKTTDILLFQSSFEVSYFVLYFIMFLTASLTLIVSEINWGSDKGLYETDYESSQIAAIIGMFNSVMYGLSAIWFFMSHRLHQNSVIVANNQL